VQVSSLSERPGKTKKRHRPEGRRRERASSDDVPALSGFVGVSGDGFVGFDVFVALDGKSARTTRFE